MKIVTPPARDDVGRRFGQLYAANKALTLASGPFSMPYGAGNVSLEKATSFWPFIQGWMRYIVLSYS